MDNPRSKKLTDQIRASLLKGGAQPDKEIPEKAYQQLAFDITNMPFKARREIGKNTGERIIFKSHKGQKLLFVDIPTQRA